MNELISQLWTPELTAGFVVVIVLLLVLYVLSIVWVVRDAYMRGTQWYIWAIVALVPGVGVIAYLLLRPPLLQIDRDEQELEIALKQRELMRYGECATCGYPVEADYVLCPNCLTQLKNLCRTCHKPLDPTWEVCPYCATPVAVVGHINGAGAVVQPEASRMEASQSGEARIGRFQKANPRMYVNKVEPAAEGSAPLEDAALSDEGAVNAKAAASKAGPGHAAEPSGERLVDLNDAADEGAAPEEKPKPARTRTRRAGVKSRAKRASGSSQPSPADEGSQASSTTEQKNNPRNAKITSS